MTGHAYRVALRVPKICAVIGWSVLRPEPRLSLRDTAAPERHSINFVNDRRALSEKCDHLPVPHLMGTTVVWFANEE